MESTQTLEIMSTDLKTGITHTPELITINIEDQAARGKVEFEFNINKHVNNKQAY